MPWSPQSKDTVTSGFIHKVQESFLDVAFGRVASLDCLLQAWGVLQDVTAQVITQNVLLRALAR